LPESLLLKCLPIGEAYAWAFEKDMNIIRKNKLERSDKKGRDFLILNIFPPNTKNISRQIFR
jgi:hypothetical protein